MENKATSVVIIVILLLMLGFMAYREFAPKSIVAPPDPIVSPPIAANNQPLTQQNTTNSMPSRSSRVETESFDGGKTLSLKTPAIQGQAEGGNNNLNQESKKKVVMIFLDAWQSPEVVEASAQETNRLVKETNLDVLTAKYRAVFSATVQKKIIEKISPILSIAPYSWSQETIVSFSLVMTDQVFKYEQSITESSQVTAEINRQISFIKSNFPELVNNLDNYTILTAMNAVFNSYNKPETIKAIKDQLQGDRRLLQPNDECKIMAEIMGSDLVINQVLILVRPDLSKPPYNWEDDQIKKFIKGCIQVIIEFGKRSTK